MNFNCLKAFVELGFDISLYNKIFGSEIVSDRREIQNKCTWYLDTVLFFFTY